MTFEKNEADQAGAIAVIDPRVLIRECVARCLQTAIGQDAVLAYANLSEWSREAPEHPPVALLLLCGDRHGPDDPQTRQELALLAEEKSLPPVVYLSENEEVDEILDALDRGAKGYIPTSVSLEVAVEALNLVKAGGAFVPASSLISARRAAEAASDNGKSEAAGLFTERQAAVVAALRQGKLNKTIAHELNMRESTVKVHVRNILRKLNARNRTQVVYLTQHLFQVEGSAAALRGSKHDAPARYGKLDRMVQAHEW